jgi:HD-GYP domain-containing protein (c-di-GMP phosphodiesterase class II)
MTSDRPYRGSIGIDRALEELRNGAGSQFDPLVVGVFVDMVECQSPGPDEEFVHALRHVS